MVGAVGGLEGENLAHIAQFYAQPQFFRNIFLRILMPRPNLDAQAQSYAQAQFFQRYFSRFSMPRPNLDAQAQS